MPANTLKMEPRHSTIEVLATLKIALHSMKVQIQYGRRPVKMKILSPTAAGQRETEKKM
jgi:hypothetical protein